MIEIIPYILVILGWHPDKPGEIGLERPEIVFLSVEECEKIGSQMAAQMTESASGKNGTVYEHHCFALPSEEEFDEAFEKLEQRKK